MRRCLHACYFVATPAAAIRSRKQQVPAGHGPIVTPPPKVNSPPFASASSRKTSSAITGSGSAFATASDDDTRSVISELSTFSTSTAGYHHNGNLQNSLAAEEYFQQAMIIYAQLFDGVKPTAGTGGGSISPLLGRIRSESEAHPTTPGSAPVPGSGPDGRSSAGEDG